MRSAGLFAVAVLAVLVLSAAMPAMAEINLLENPGFEEGVLYPWRVSGDGGFAGGLSDPNVGAHGGVYFARLEAYPADVSLYQVVSPARCAQSLELYYRGSITGEGYLMIQVHYSDDSHDYWHPAQTEDWSRFYRELNPDKLVTEVEAFVGASVYGELDVDDFDLEACGGPEQAVGGVVNPANTLALVAPWIAVIGLVGCIGIVVLVIRKRRS